MWSELRRRACGRVALVIAGFYVSLPPRARAPVLSVSRQPQVGGAYLLLPNTIVSVNISLLYPGIKSPIPPIARADPVSPVASAIGR